MQHLLNQMRMQSGLGQNFLAQCRLGLITSYNPDNSTVVVQIQPVDEDDPQGSLTGFIPWATPYVGLNFAPRIGDQAIVIFQEGDINCGIAIGCLYSDADLPPPAPSGEIWLNHASGTQIRIKNNGEVDITAPAGLTITGNVQINGNLVVSGDISDLNASKESMDGMRTIYNSHVHPLPGGGDTLQTTETM